MSLPMHELNGLIKRILYKYFNYYNHYGLSEQDMLQSGIEVYLTYLHDFREEPEFNKLSSLIRTEFTRIKRKCEKNDKIVSFSSRWHEEREDKNPVQFTSEAERGLYNKLEFALSVLTPKEEYIVYNICLALTPKSRHEIARELNITAQRVGQLLVSAEEKMAKYLEDASYE